MAWSQVNLHYLLLGLVRRHVPKKFLFALMEYRGDSSLAEQSPDKCLAIWQDQFTRREWNFKNKHVLEIGSGRYARFALQMLASGACRVTLIDLYAVPLDHPEHRAILIRDCAALGIDCDDAVSRIEVMAGDITRLPFPANENKVDLAVSHSVLEHVNDPVTVLLYCWKWLKPGGSIHHIVDLRDHNLKFRYPFEMLTFSEKVWRRWLDLDGGFHLNRWRLPDYLRATQESGFVNVGYEVLLSDEAALNAVLPRLDFRFRSMDKQVLAILSISLFGQKP